MDKLCVAVIGVGFWGLNHARVFSELPNAELVAVCDKSRERARNGAKQFGVKAYTGSKRLLRRNDVEAVSICTWTTMHAREVTKALKARKHVLVEKPIAETVRQARQIVDLAESSRQQLMTGFIERFNPGVKRVKDAINDGKIGSPVLATARRVSKWPERIGDVGVIKDTAIHDLDIMRYLFAEEPVAVYAMAGNLRHRRFEDYAQIMLTFDGGKTAFIEANWLTPYKVRSLSVTGSGAIINVDYITQKITMETAGQSLTPRYEWQEPLKLELQHFVDCILHDEETRVTGVDGLKALQIAEATLKSAQKHKTIKLK